MTFDSLPAPARTVILLSTSNVFLTFAFLFRHA